MKEENIIPCRTAAKILAAAALELFPKVKLIRGDASEVGFFYEFYFPGVLPKDLLFVLEERMKGLVAEKREIHIQEMIASNACAYFSHRQKHWELPLESDNALVSVVRIGEFADIVDGEVLPNTKDLSFFSLISEERNGDCITIKGVAGSNRESVKEEQKRLKRYQKENHLVYGEQLKLFAFSGEDCLWYPSGVLVKDLLIHFWKKHLMEQRFFFVETPGNLHSYVHLEERFSRVAEVCYEPGLMGMDLLTRNAGPFIRETIFSSSLEEDLVSSLLFIRKILMIFRFSYVAVLYNDKPYFSKLIEKLDIPVEKRGKKEGFSGPVVEFEIEDGLGRKWPGPYVGVGSSLFGKRDLSYSKVEKKFSSMIERSSLGKVERFIALLLEVNEGKLPFWLSPKQVCVTGKGKEVDELFLQCRNMGLRVEKGERKKEASVLLHVKEGDILFFHEGQKEALSRVESINRLVNLQNQEKL